MENIGKVSIGGSETDILALTRHSGVTDEAGCEANARFTVTETSTSVSDSHRKR